MSDHRNAATLVRALSRVTVETVEAQRDRDRMLAGVGAADMLQHLTLNARGRAGRRMNYTETKVFWPYPFLNRVAQARMDSGMLTPGFSSGVEMTTAGHVMLDVQVRDWIANDSDFLIGALMRIGAWAPAAPKLTKYSAIVHLTFFGYGAPSEDDSEE